jgi:predicted phosphate transport protein (TIGR00153 family)
MVILFRWVAARMDRRLALDQAAQPPALHLASRRRLMVLGKLGLFPRDEKFFDLFERNAQYLVEGGKALVLALENPEALDAQGEHLIEVEHWCDEVTHQVMAALNRTFVTPLDREDIAGLAHALDDVADFMEAALTRMLLFKLRNPSPLAQNLAQIILQQTEAINRAVPLLRRKEDMPGIQACLVEINRLENEGDRLLERALADLYEDVPDIAALVERLKWREVYELLETATDRAEDVANTLEGIVLKNA